jgi:4-amino-4-deoxy-L-arabinose transferase-like glycosyltransferase
MDTSQSIANAKWLYPLIGIAVLVNFSGLFIPIIGPDGTLYALIAKTMVLRNDYVDLFVHGKDWLDKPHFPFWVTAISFKCFGFTTWAYKLPGILFLMMGAVYTYLFAGELYNKRVACLSVLILLTAQHIILSNNDVRAEPYLTGLIIASVYHFYRANKYNNFWQLTLGCLFAACAIMTKGMFALVPIGGAIVGQLVITKQWRSLFNWRWLIAIVLVLIFISPEIYCLYQQFDIHPEKVVFGQKAVSGIKFFFWDSQFGRFFNTGPIKGHGDPFFFVHTTLWAFLPWSLLLFAAIFQFIKKGIKNTSRQEWFCISAALLTFLLFSASKFQLPHYLNIVFPFFAILTAQYLFGILLEKSVRAIRITQIIVVSLLFLILLVLNYFFEPAPITWLISLLLVILLAITLLLPGNIGNTAIAKTIFFTVLTSFIINVYLNTIFYPSLMRYQAGSVAAVWINENNPGKLPVAEFNDDFVSAFEFYSNAPVQAIDVNTGKLPTKPFLLYAPVDAVKKLVARGTDVTVLGTFKRYWVSRLKPAFLNKNTREKELTTTLVVFVK